MHKAHRIVCPLPLLRANACTWHFRLRAHSLINRTPNNSPVSPNNIKNWKFCNWMHFPISELSSLHIVLLSQQNTCATESGEDVSKVATSPLSIILILFYAFYHIYFLFHSLRQRQRRTQHYSQSQHRIEFQNNSRSHTNNGSCVFSVGVLVSEILLCKL